MTNDNLLKLSERDYIGPGVWMMIHLLALHSEDSSKLKAAFPEIVEILRKYFPCEDCRRHFIEETDKFPVEFLADKNEGIFKWSYLIHKSVNERLKKETPKYEEARKYFKSPESCKSCGSKQEYSLTN